MKPARIEMQSAAMALIRREGEKAFPNECCGFLLGCVDQGVTRVEKAMPAANEDTAGAAHRYAIASPAYRACEKAGRAAGLDIVGFYHSHPGSPATPSAFDTEGGWPWYAYVISSVHDRRTSDVTGWRLREDRARFEPLDLRGAL